MKPHTVPLHPAQDPQASTSSAPYIQPSTLSWHHDPGPLEAEDPPSDVFSEGQ